MANTDESVRAIPEATAKILRTLDQEGARLEQRRGALEYEHDQIEAIYQQKRAELARLFYENRRSHAPLADSVLATCPPGEEWRIDYADMTIKRVERQGPPK